MKAKSTSIKNKTHKRNSAQSILEYIAIFIGIVVAILAVTKLIKDPLKDLYSNRAPSFMGNAVDNTLGTMAAVGN